MPQKENNTLTPEITVKEVQNDDRPLEILDKEERSHGLNLPSPRNDSYHYKWKDLSEEISNQRQICIKQKEKIDKEIKEKEIDKSKKKLEIEKTERTPENTIIISPRTPECDTKFLASEKSLDDNSVEWWANQCNLVKKINPDLVFLPKFSKSTTLDDSNKKWETKNQKNYIKENSENELIDSKKFSCMNLPASKSTINIIDGVEHLVFTYSTKGHVQEYSIRINIDQIDVDTLPSPFKTLNCVYPRACVPEKEYTGNRYNYETQVNCLAWKLTWANEHILGGRRGLIQRAVDSFRNRFENSRSRRVIRQDKINNGTLRRRATETESVKSRRRNGINNTPTDEYLTIIQYKNKKGKITTVKIRMDIEKVDVNKIDEKFKANNCLFPNATAFNASYNSNIYIFEYAMNELGWKLAYLNQNKLSGKKVALLAAIEAFRAKFDHPKNSNHMPIDLKQSQNLGYGFEYPAIYEEPNAEQIIGGDSPRYVSLNGIVDDQVPFNEYAIHEYNHYGHSSIIEHDDYNFSNDYY